MNRVLILLSAVLVAVIGLLLLQNGNTRNPADLAFPGEAVSEVDNVETVSAARPNGTENNVAPGSSLDILNGAVQASFDPAPVSDLPAPNDLVSEGSAAPADGDADMRDMTSSVLVGLGITPPPAPAPRKADTHSAIREATALALVSLGKGTEIGGAGASPAEIKARVLQSLRSGDGDAIVDALLHDAVASGDLAVPSGMITSDGNLDTRALLTSLVQQSMTSDPALAASEELLDAIADSTSNTRLALSTGKDNTRYYVVEPGDSLAYISMMIYGDAVHYHKIFEANRAQLPAPDKIQVGQRLLIPRNI
ncbi:MAG: LysM peptidoglycan-binding domain-containing protein [Maritimibacter sp.]